MLLQNLYQPIVVEHPLIGLITNPKTLQARLSLKSPATHNAKYPSTTKRTSEIAPFAFYVYGTVVFQINCSFQFSLTFIGMLLAYKRQHRHVLYKLHLHTWARAILPLFANKRTDYLFF